MMNANNLKRMQVQILIGIPPTPRRYHDTRIAKKMAMEDMSLEDDLRILEEQELIVKWFDQGHASIELTDKAREYLIENDLYRSFRLL